jgi:hypothetical protein
MHSPHRFTFDTFSSVSHLLLVKFFMLRCFTGHESNSNLELIDCVGDGPYQNTRGNYCHISGFCSDGPYQNTRGNRCQFFASAMMVLIKTSRETIVKFLVSAMMVLIKIPRETKVKFLASAMVVTYHDILDTIAKVSYMGNLLSKFLVLLCWCFIKKQGEAIANFFGFLVYYTKEQGE